MPMPRPSASPIIRARDYFKGGAARAAQRGYVARARLLDRHSATFTEWSRPAFVAILVAAEYSQEMIDRAVLNVEYRDATGLRNALVKALDAAELGELAARVEAFDYLDDLVLIVRECAARLAVGGTDADHAALEAARLFAALTGRGEPLDRCLAAAAQAAVHPVAAE